MPNSLVNLGGKLGRYGPEVEANMAAYKLRYPGVSYIAVTNITGETLFAGQRCTVAGRGSVVLLRDIPPGGSGVGM